MRGKMIAGAAVAGIAGLIPAVSQAAVLDYQFRINGAAGTDTFGSATKSATVTNGQVVTLDLYAVLNGSDGTRTNDGFERSIGSFASSNGGLLGEFRSGTNGTDTTTVNNVSPFKGTGAAAGRASDLDGDGDLDVGSNQTSGLAVPFPWFFAYTEAGNGVKVLGTGAGNVLEFVIGQILFTVGNNTGETSLNYVPRVQTDGGSAGPRHSLFRIDGVDYAIKADGSGVKGGTTAVTGAMSVGVPVVLVNEVPEPASLGLLGIGAAALLRRRKA
jgi:hypothetical protein